MMYLMMYPVLKVYVKGIPSYSHKKNKIKH